MKTGIPSLQWAGNFASPNQQFCFSRIAGYVAPNITYFLMSHDSIYWIETPDNMSNPILKTRAMAGTSASVFKIN